MKNKTQYHSWLTNVVSGIFTGGSRTILILLLFVVAGKFNANAQAPSCNLTGPLKAYLNGKDL
jgi:hypothetical protein